MVMNARKLPRLSDGYFDRNQAHPYQNSGKYSKVGYGSSAGGGGGGGGGGSDRYNNDKVRDSPSNGNASYRGQGGGGGNGGGGGGESPEGRSRPSPRDRSYHNKASYSQRIKERERERDNKHVKDPNKEKAKPSGNREHYHGGPVHRGNQDGSSSSSCNSEHRNNNDRIANNSEEKEKEKRLQVGEWSEHISSSGKKYYYSCKTEISQWEKPKEWMEWERHHGKVFNDGNKLKDGVHDKSVVDKQHSSGDRNARSFVGHPHHSSSFTGGGSRPHEDRYHSRTGVVPVSTSSSSSQGHSSFSSDHLHRKNQQEQQQQFKDDRSSSRRDIDRIDHRHDPLRRDGERRTKGGRKSSDDSQVQDMDISSDGTPPGTQSDSHSQNQTPVSFSNQQQHTGGNNQQTPPSSSSGNSSLANLPKLLSQLSNKEKPELSAHEALQTLQTALYLTRQVTLANPSVPSQSPHSSLCNQSDMSPFLPQRSPITSSTQQNHGISGSMLSSDQKLRTDDDRDRVGKSSPGSEYSHRSSRRDSPTSSICSLQGISTSGTTSLASASIRPTAPTLSPSLANYFREDLIGHIMGWQADHAERQVGSGDPFIKRLRHPESSQLNVWQKLLQANKYSDDAHHLGSLTCTKVSADLKMARSLVRVNEIQATVQEQRVLFLRQQIKELEEWKSKNSFMSDS